MDSGFHPRGFGIDETLNKKNQIQFKFGITTNNYGNDFLNYKNDKDKKLENHSTSFHTRRLMI